MRLRILIDMNLSPEWADVLARHDHETVHWSTVGNPDDADRVIFDWARVQGFIIFTHDLDFGTLLALTHSAGPSVLQIRTQKTLPEHLEATVVSLLDRHGDALISGALVVADTKKSRVRILPI